MKKFILIPTILTLASTPLISLVGCNKPKDDTTVINVNINKGKTFHLESKPFSLEKDTTYTLNFDLEQWIGGQAEIGSRSVIFSNQYLPNITSFVYKTVIYDKANNLSEINQGVTKYYVGPNGSDNGVFFFAVDEANDLNFQIKFLSNIEVENITVELNGH